MKHWRTVFVPTDIPNPIDGGQLYVWAIVRPRWYWFLRRVWLFVRIVWRPIDSPDIHHPFRAGLMDWRTAWEVSQVAQGLTESPLWKE